MLLQVGVIRTIDFTKPEDEENSINQGLLWQGELFRTARYDRRHHVRWCFQCQNYGHIEIQHKAITVFMQLAVVRMRRGFKIALLEGMSWLALMQHTRHVLGITRYRKFLGRPRSAKRWSAAREKISKRHGPAIEDESCPGTLPERTELNQHRTAISIGRQ